jgi:predicted PurR-regulated permease PerM
MKQWMIPFVVALILSYALHVPAQTISRMLHISRTAVAGIIVLLLIAIVAVFGMFLVPLIKNATVVLIQKIPVLSHVLPAYINDVLQNVSRTFGVERTFDIGGEFQRYISEIARNLPSYVPDFLDTGKTLVYVVMFTLMTPILIFYMLKDWPQIEQTFVTLLKKIAPAHIEDIIKKINTKLGAYIKGQLLVCCVLSIIYVPLFLFVGVDQYIFCGLFSGFLAIAPFLGPFLSLLTTLALSYDEFY